MNMIEEYLIEKGLTYKEVNGQFNLLHSPVSGEDKRHHFYLNADTGMRDDKKSGHKGNFDQFRAMYGDEGVVLPESSTPRAKREYRTLDYSMVRTQQARLLGLEPKLLDYLQNARGLSMETIKHFKLGAVEGGHISIPIFSKSEELVNIRKRTNPYSDAQIDVKYFTEAGCKSILFNEGIFNKFPKEVYLTEGEFDAMCLWQRGLKNVVSTTLGAGYFSDERADNFKDVKKVYICYDSDEAGVNGAMKAAEKIGMDKCRIIELPKEGEKSMDISDYFMKKNHTIEEFKELVKKSKMPTSFDSDIIKHISEFNDELRVKLLQGDYRGIPSGFEKLDEIIGGFRKGRVIILSGLTSTGKTTASINFALSLARRQIPSMYVSMEMPPIDISKKILMLNQKISGQQLEDLKETDPLMETVDEGLKAFKGEDGSDGLPIYLYNSVGELSLKGVIDVCKVSKEVYGTEVLIIDHLHYFAQGSKNQTAEVSAAMRAVKNMAMELDIPVVLLCHLNRGGRSQQRRGLYIPTLADLKDSGTIEQDADQVVYICRDSEASNELDKRKSIAKVAKNRDGSTGYVSMDLDLSIGLFREVETDYMQEAEASLESKYSKKKAQASSTTNETLDSQAEILF